MAIFSPSRLSPKQTTSKKESSRSSDSHYITKAPKCLFCSDASVKFTSPSLCYIQTDVSAGETGQQIGTVSGHVTPTLLIFRFINSFLLLKQLNSTCWILVVVSTVSAVLELTTFLKSVLRFAFTACAGHSIHLQAYTLPCKNTHWPARARLQTTRACLGIWRACVHKHSLFTLGLTRRNQRKK